MFVISVATPKDVAAYSGIWFSIDVEHPLMKLVDFGDGYKEESREDTFCHQYL